MFAKYGIHNLPHSPGIGQNSERGISDFQISGQSLIKGYCHNSKTSDDFDMRPGPVNLTRDIKQHQENWMMTSCQKIVMLL